MKNLAVSGLLIVCMVAYQANAEVASLSELRAVDDEKTSAGLEQFVDDTPTKIKEINIQVDSGLEAPSDEISAISDRNLFSALFGPSEKEVKNKVKTKYKTKYKYEKKLLKKRNKIRKGKKGNKTGGTDAADDAGGDDTSADDDA